MLLYNFVKVDVFSSTLFIILKQHASLAYDEMDPNTREIKFGIIGAETLQQDEYDYITSNNEKQYSETAICG